MRGCREGKTRTAPGVLAFGERVRELREARGLSQEKLAEAAEVHRAEVGFVERGEREIGIALAWRFADGLQISLAELVDNLP